MTTVVTRGAASAQALGYAARATAANYIEDVFSTYLYQGNDSTQTIVNGIDLSTKGGLVWGKARNDSDDHNLYDTARGVQLSLSSNLTEEQVSRSGLTAFNTNGYTLGSGTSDNYSLRTYASWTFRKQPKFFDVVTYSGNSVSGRLISQSLGSAPGCIIVKCTNLAGTNWAVWHRSLATGYNLQLQSTNAAFNTKPAWFNSSTQGSSTTFEVGNDTDTNETGNTYVAYLFAHDAGGFGTSGADNVITCGSLSSSNSFTASLGYEPQWILLKPSSAVGNWQVIDTTRRISGTDASSGSATGATFLNPNLSSAETFNTSYNINVSPTGFKTNGMSGTWVYVAIRRGPMKTPTSGTSVLGLNARSGNNVNTNVTGGFLADAVLIKNRGSAVADLLSARLTTAGYLVTSSTVAEADGGGTILAGNPWDVMNGIEVGTTSTITNASGNTYINYLLGRAPGFFDVVCYAGNSTAGRQVTHNLGVTPELIFVKVRTVADENWECYNASVGNTKTLRLQSTAAAASSTVWNNTSPTSTYFVVGASGNFGSVNYSTYDYVAYLFATCPGVSKVGSYTGSGTTKQIDCGFTGGARFVLIKRTDSTGGWYVWDSARGIVAGDDPYFLLNSAAAEVTNTDYIDTYSAGFEISSTAPAEINANGGTFIFLAIA